MSECVQQPTVYGTFIQVPRKNHYWIDSHLSHHSHPLAILSPEDKAKLGEVKSLSKLHLKLISGGDVRISAQVKAVHYHCDDTVFYYQDPREKYFNYPKICPLGHPAYDEDL
jgi:hypothetical protein